MDRGNLMTTILITGVDDSDTALQAALKAAWLAERLNGQLHVVSAYGASETRSRSDGLEKVVVDNAADAQRIADDVARTIREQHPDLAVEARATAGKPADALVSAAEQLDADLIVVGNKRVQGMSRILGSIARSVAAEAPCDLYVVNTHQRS